MEWGKERKSKGKLSDVNYLYKWSAIKQAGVSLNILPRSFLVFSAALIIHEQKALSKEISSVIPGMDPEATEASSTLLMVVVVTEDDAGDSQGQVAQKNSSKE